MCANNTEYRLAIDLGATSGRHILGKSNQDGTIELTEVYRFPTGAERTRDGYVWDTKRIFEHIKNGIKIAFEKCNNIQSLAIDSWGVDYVLMRGDESVLPHYAYRDLRTLDAVDKVHAIVPFEELYKRTGIQFASYNTIYALYNDLERGRLEGVTDFLMTPEYYAYLLTGNKVKEYTMATTTGLVNVKSRAFDTDIIDRLGLPRNIFGALDYPGTVVGTLTEDVAKEVGGNTVVKLCASHDTACAFEAVSAEDGVLISSGTWSLVGVKLKDACTTEDAYRANFSNEGGVEYYRFLKNVTGMWLINEVLKKSGLKVTEAVKMATESTYNHTFDVNDQRLLAPDDMAQEIRSLLKNPPSSDADLYRAIFLSLAEGYKKAVSDIESTTGKKYDKIYIVGGGAHNNLLNQMTALATGKTVTALPIEATAVGNIKTQTERL